MPAQMPDRLFVQEVLAGKHSSANFVTDTPLIAQIESEGMPHLPSADSLIGAACIADFMLCTAFFLANLLLKITLPLAFLVAAVVFVSVGGGVLFAMRKRAINRHDKRMQEACVELADTVDELKTFLARLDERMVRYFNSNTISDSYTLFILMQVRGLMENRLKKICILLSDPSRKNLLRVHRYFARQIGIRDSVIEGLGREHNIPISEIGRIVGPLIEYLQENLLAIEAEKAQIDAELQQNAKGWKAA